MRICVVGGGRMGLPLAATFAGNGADVVVADISAALVAQVNASACPYEEPGLSALITSLSGTGRLTASVDTSAAVASSSAVVVIVPAHLTSEREIDLSILKAASSDIGRGLRPDTLVVYETTVSMGATQRELLPVLEASSGLVAGRDFSLGYSPERVKANLVLERLATTPKVVGGFDAQSLSRTAELYRRYLRAPVDEVGSLEAAEMTKLVGMLYRDVNIALVNELAAFCESASVDFERVRRAANHDGEAQLLSPGIGVGGHCTPVYPYFLTREARRRGVTQRISELAREVNDLQPARQLARVSKHWRELLDQRVHILGLGFRPGVKVDTFSPAYPIRDELLRLGARVSLEDPLYSVEEVRNAGFSPGTCSDAKLVILNTAHREFEQPDFTKWHADGVEAVLDGRNYWNQQDVERPGMIYFGVGRASRPERDE